MGHVVQSRMFGMKRSKGLEGDNMKVAVPSVRAALQHQGRHRIIRSGALRVHSLSDTVLYTPVSIVELHSLQSSLRPMSLI
jgi:hypothetical protein